MSRRTTLRLCLGLLLAAVTSERAWSGSITGRREGQFGGGIHESFIWAQGVGSNSTPAHGIGFTWGGDYTIDNLPAGQYHLAANEHGPYFQNILDDVITVPGSGSVVVDIHDRKTMGTQGQTDLDACQWAAQTFVATGRDLDEVVVITPSGGTQVEITIRQGGPMGTQIGPGHTITNGSLFPSGAHWRPGEVPLVPGRQYTVRLDYVSGGDWDPALGYKRDVYPNGHAWLDGEPIPEADLSMDIVCRDTGFLDEYRVNSWWRSNTFTELIQTFVAQGEALRIAQMMPAGDTGGVMRASVHEWSPGNPPGLQVGDAKHASMSSDLMMGFVWGPGEVPLSPGLQYAIRFVRADGQSFAIYGDSDKYDQGQAYFDGVPNSGIDVDGRLITKEQDRGDIAVSNLTFTPLSSTEVRATFQTDVVTTATVAYRTGSPPFDTIWPADEVPKLSHDVTVRHLAPDTTYDMWVLAYNENRNVLNDKEGAVPVPTPTEFATFAGHVHSQVGPIAGAEVILEQADLTTFTDALGNFAFPSAPTGRHTLRVQAVACESATQEVDVTADGLGFADVETAAYTNLLAGTDDNPIAGWTMYGDFDGQYDNGDYSIYARTGPKWVGYVTNWPDMSPGVHGGGIYRTMTVEAGKTYRFGGFIQTHAFGSSNDPIDGLAVAHIGVDPTGGTDPYGHGVIWDRMRFTSGRWMEQTVDFTATGSEVTLFTHHKWEYFYDTPVWYIAAFDDLWLGRPRLGIPDFDRDGDVDLEDFGHFQVCLSGPGAAQDDPLCTDARLDEDEDVDQDDFTIFQGCLSGADVAYDSSCAD